MNLYFRGVFIVGFLVLMLGWALPALISAKSTELVVFGLLAMVFGVPFTGWCIQGFIKEAKKTFASKTGQ